MSDALDALDKLYLEKRLNLTEYSTEDSTEDSMEDSTEVQYIERKLHKMEKKQISDKEVENISTENTPKKEQTVSPPFLPSYTKSYCQTHIESTTLEHTWKIDQFIHFSKIKNMITFPSFSEIGQCEILMSISRQDSSRINAIKCYILTNNSFGGSCTTTIMYAPRQYYDEPSYDELSSNFISGHISNMTLLIEFSERFSFNPTDALIVHCKFEIFHNLINKTIRMNLLPSTEVSKDVICSEDSTFDEFRSKDKDSIKFIVGKEQYVLSRKSLCATNSSYFKNICLTHKGKEKNMTNELVTDNAVKSFRQILLYILTGSIDQSDYDMLKDILIAAHTYDVPTLKLTCQHYLLRSLTIKNAVELMQFALSLNAKFLETHLATFIKFHIKEIMDTKTFKSLSREDSNKMMELIKKSKFEVSTHKFLSPLTTDGIFTLANNPDNSVTSKDSMY
ncbi:TD and POZ domain-containing protein 5-like [Temnothorax nylanderi]|uniref:TD and POZ domain-containing protein 5-like n=1 Tax=Temnothorax nylanderi TaxID=102681 RepID=UPI003A84A548